MSLLAVERLSERVLTLIGCLSLARADDEREASPIRVGREEAIDLTVVTRGSCVYTNWTRSRSIRTAPVSCERELKELSDHGAHCSAERREDPRDCK